jgi:kynurenine formamidase
MQISTVYVSNMFAASTTCIAELEALLQLVQACKLHVCALAVACTGTDVSPTGAVAIWCLTHLCV